MNKTIQNLVRKYETEGARQHASWEGSVFDALGAGPAGELWEGLQKSGGKAELQTQVYEGYLRLIQEGVGRGYLQQATGGNWSNLMELILVQFVPEQLPSIKPAKRLEELATVWNLLEGLLGEPAWINQLVLARALEFKRLTDLQQFLVEVLDPVLSPAPNAAWTGPFQQTVLDARPIDEDFLPGEMMLAAPWVLCIKDRRRPVRLGVLLQKSGKSEFIGPLPELEPYRDSTPLPKVEVKKNAIQIGKHHFKLTRLNQPHQYAIARAGFVVASALDSQRIWVVESA
ncbi:MAG: hypothetical protein KDA84_05040 [Planctomycetaceae bacterium]|nr:hypothetical protein [Planctomycetaceae bacterium]